MQKFLFLNIYCTLIFVSCSIWGKKNKPLSKSLESINFCGLIDSLQKDTTYDSRVKYQILDKKTIYVNDTWNANAKYSLCNDYYFKDEDSLCKYGRKLVDSLKALNFRVVLRFKHLKVEGRDNGDLSNFSFDSLQTGNHIYRLMFEKARIFIADSLQVDKNAIFRDKELSLYFYKRFRQFYFSYSYYDCILKSVKNK